MDFLTYNVSENIFYKVLKYKNKLKMTISKAFLKFDLRKDLHEMYHHVYSSVLISLAKDDLLFVVHPAA